MPTSNGLSYSMNSFPRIACTIGALSVLASWTSSAWAPAHPAPPRIVTFSEAFRSFASAAISGSEGQRLDFGCAKGGPAGCSTASRRAMSPGSAITDTPRRESAVWIAISRTRGMSEGWETSSQ